MTSLIYRPVLIESAEQAEQLPIFTIATIEVSPATGYPEVARKIVGGWRNRDLVDGCIPHADMIGWTALVPVEARVEWSARQPHPGGGTRGRTHFGVHESHARKHCDIVTEDVVECRLVTEWKPA